MKKVKRIMALIITAAVMMSCIPCSAAADYAFTIYNSSFEQEDITFERKEGKAEYTSDEAHTGTKSVRVSEYSAEEKAPRISLAQLNREAAAEVSVWVKPEKETRTSFTLWLFIKNTDGEKKYKLGEKSSTGGWVNISGTMFTKYITMSSSPQIAVTAKNEEGFAAYFADDLLVVSNRDTAAKDNPVEELKPNGKYTIRASFENNTLDFFTLNRAEYFITDEVPAHTGQYCMKITNRQFTDGTMMIYFPEAAYDATISISCWVRNAPGNSTRYSLQGIIPTAAGTQWPGISSTVSGSENGWTKVSGTIDCKQYKVSGTVGVQIVAGVTLGQLPEYYVDDVYITTDTDGELFDDLTYVPEPRPEGISDSPAQASADYKEIEEDLPALKDVFKDYFKLGACVQNRTESDTTRYGRLLKKHFNSVVSDGMFKMGEILPGQNNKTDYEFTYCDTLMDFAQRNGMEVAGHVLIWDASGLKKYVRDENGELLDKDTTLSFMKEYITKVMKHMEGDGDAEEYISGVDYSDWHINVWDVVNEAVVSVDENGVINYRKNGVWFDVLGADYIDYAFKFAEEVGYKDIALRYNDFVMGEPVYQLVKGLKERGRRVDNIGMQSHYHAGGATSHIRGVLDRYISLGVKVDITETDVQAYSTMETNARTLLYEDGVPQEVENNQASLQAEAFKIYREYADHIDRVVFWTFADGFSCYNWDSFKRIEYAGIFDRDYQAKPQYWAIADPDKFYRDILNEDSSTTRIIVDTVEKPLKNKEQSVVDKNGVKYMDVSEMLEDLNINYATFGGEYSFIKNGSLYELTSGDTIKRAFGDLKLTNAVIEENGKTYMPIVEMAELMGYYVEYNENRNIINISSEATKSGN